jgi:hypothetical protein
MATETLHVFISGFGAPHLEHKLHILRRNMAIIERHPWSRVQYTICVYDDSHLGEIETMPHVRVIRDPLIVGQFLQKYLVPGTEATDFTYLLCILDDVELQDNADFGWMIHYLEMFDIDLLSPSMTLDSKYQFFYMLHTPSNTTHSLRVTSALEYFCYFMRPSSYQKYYHHINGERNPWMWGLDMVLYRHLNLKLGVMNHMTMKHWYKNENYYYRPDANPGDGYDYVLDRYNETKERLENQPSILYMILHVGIEEARMAKNKKYSIE